MTIPEQGPAVAGAQAEAERPLGRSLLRGWHGTCPNCGEGALFSQYLTVTETCGTCGEALHHHRADDLPAWLTMVVVGHVLAVLLLAVENALAPALWIHAMIWPPLVIGLCLWLLPRVKGAVVGMQWTWRMHGFGDDAD
ncbi:MAG: DUF983 domain-containing protein [Pseudomonadota bacterium]